MRLPLARAQSSPMRIRSLADSTLADPGVAVGYWDDVHGDSLGKGIMCNFNQGQM